MLIDIVKLIKQYYFTNHKTYNFNTKTYNFQLIQNYFISILFSLT